MLANVLFTATSRTRRRRCCSSSRGACGVVAVTHAAMSRATPSRSSAAGDRSSVAILNKGELRIRQGSDERVEPHPPASNFHLPLIEDFVDAVVDDREPGVTGDIGREIARLEQAIYANGAAQ